MTREGSMEERDVQAVTELAELMGMEERAAGGAGLVVIRAGARVIGVSGPLELLTKLERAASAIISPGGAEALRHGYAYN